MNSASYFALGYLFFLISQKFVIRFCFPGSSLGQVIWMTIMRSSSATAGQGPRGYCLSHSPESRQQYG